MPEKRLAADQVPTAGAGGTTVLIENAILSSRLTSSIPDFFALPGGLVLKLLATATHFVYTIGSTTVTVSVDTSISVTNNVHNFVWIDDLANIGVSTKPCTYSYVAPGGVTTGQHWFDLSNNQMNSWNGSAWVAVNRIFIGYVRADSGTINARYVCEPIGVDPFLRYQKGGDGSDGFLDLISGTTTIDGSHQYTAVIARGTTKIVHTAVSKQLLEILTQSMVVLLDTASIDVTGLGFIGGVHSNTTPTAGQGGGLGGAGGNGGSGGSTGVGGGHISLTSLVPFAGGGYDGFGDGLPGDDSPLIGNPYLRDLMFPYGNGGGGGRGTNGGDGSPGGGYFEIHTPLIVLATGAALKAEGAPGNAGFAAGAGGSGGGGVIALEYRILVNGGTISVVGGVSVGSPGGGAARSGGAGGSGAVLTRKF